MSDSEDGQGAVMGAAKLQASVEKLVSLLQGALSGAQRGAAGQSFGGLGAAGMQANMGEAAGQPPRLALVQTEEADKDELALRLRDRAMPAWATEAGLVNARGRMTWDHSQYIAAVAIGDYVIDMLVDTGGACSIMDVAYARSLGLPVRPQTKGEFGWFTVPGRSVPMAYPAIVPGPLKMQFAEGVSVWVPFLRLVDHGRNLAILGANTLMAGDQGGVEFVGLGPGKLAGARGTQGWMQFATGGGTHTIPLVSAPVRGLEFVRHADGEEPTKRRQANV